MTNATLDEHQARVERAERSLRADLQRLGARGRRIQQSLGTGKMLVLLGGALLLGVLGVRAASRRQRQIVLRTRPEAPSLMGTAVRMALLEAARLAATRLVHRFAGVFEPRQTPELLATTSRAGAMQRRNE